VKKKREKQTYVAEFTACSRGSSFAMSKEQQLQPGQDNAASVPRVRFGRAERSVCAKPKRYAACRNERKASGAPSQSSASPKRPAIEHPGRKTHYDEAG
jgi:hypothetical protein